MISQYKIRGLLTQRVQTGSPPAPFEPRSGSISGGTKPPAELWVRRLHSPMISASRSGADNRSFATTLAVFLPAGPSWVLPRARALIATLRRAVSEQQPSESYKEERNTQAQHPIPPLRKSNFPKAHRSLPPDDLSPRFRYPIAPGGAPPSKQLNRCEPPHAETR